jgi:endonuclease/exonuclease/phosphatase family metal-dependent hydrolase
VSLPATAPSAPLVAQVPPRSQLRIVTFNLLNDLRYWEARAPLIVEGMSRLAADVIALQEVSLPANNAQWLADQLGGYAVYLAQGTGWRQGREGIAILSRRSVHGADVLAFGAQGRVAQAVAVEQDGAEWTVCNVHLHWSPYDDRTRRGQVRRLLQWLPDESPTVVCGDLNAEPHYSAVAALRERFVSCQESAFGREQRPTFPTKLRRGPGVRHAGRRAALGVMGLAKTHRAGSWQGVLDYILVDRCIQVVRCDVVLDQPSAHDPKLYPSDHRGLLAQLALAPRTQ